MRNKIKWEVLTTIVISITSVFVAIKANDISNLQAEIAINSALPTIEVDEKVTAENSFNGKERSIIEISNLGGKINNYQSKVITFLECQYSNEDKVLFERYNIPVISYYYVYMRSGAITGVIEEIDTSNSYDILKELDIHIMDFNKEQEYQQTIVAELCSYLEIRYIDLLGEKRRLYYQIDSSGAFVLDDEVGQKKFDEYYYLTNAGCGIDLNRNSNISVDEVLGNINGISELEMDKAIYQNAKRERKPKMNLLDGNILNRLIGGFGTILGGILAVYYEQRKKIKHAASVLFYDLHSIEVYLKETECDVNLRFSTDWQNMVAGCTFLSGKNVELIYKIYDGVYNYNYHYQAREEAKEPVTKNDIMEYSILATIMFEKSSGGFNFDKYNQEYEKLLCALKKQIKK